MSVVLNHAVNGQSATSVDPDYIVFPAAQNIVISDADDSIAIGDGTGTLADVTAANALKVDGSAVTQPVSGTFWQATQPVSGPLTDTQLRASAVPISAASLPLPTGAATAALQTQPGVDIGDVTINNSTGASAVNIQDGGNSITVDGTVAATQSGTWNTAHLVASAASLSNVNDQATNATLLNSNASRRGMLVHNDSTSILYLKYGTTATTTSYTVKIAADGYWEMPLPVYTGQVDGIWSADASGAARVTELT